MFYPRVLPIRLLLNQVWAESRFNDYMYEQERSGSLPPTHCMNMCLVPCALGLPNCLYPSLYYDVPTFFCFESGPIFGLGALMSRGSKLSHKLFPTRNTEMAYPRYGSGDVARIIFSKCLSTRMKLKLLFSGTIRASMPIRRLTGNGLLFTFHTLMWFLITLLVIHIF